MFNLPILHNFCKLGHLTKVNFCWIASWVDYDIRTSSKLTQKHYLQQILSINHGRNCLTCTQLTYCACLHLLANCRHDIFAYSMIATGFPMIAPSSESLKRTANKVSASKSKTNCKYLLIYHCALCNGNDRKVITIQFAPVSHWYVCNHSYSYIFVVIR